MSDKVIRHYSRPYGDCRADKRLYFGGSWPWQQGAECEIPTPEPVDDSLGVLDVSTNYYNSPAEIFRSFGDYDFQIFSQNGLTLTITNITATNSNTIVNTFPFNVDDTLVTVNCSGSESCDLTIYHNGINSPFIVNVLMGS